MSGLKNRLLTIACTGALCLSQSALALPPGMNTQGDLSEATAFFMNIAQTSSNPVIANMARENLQRIQAGDLGRTVAEVALLPQDDNTYVVPARINRKFMASFLIDTGASYTVITPQTARALGVVIPRDAEMVPITTANGTVDAPIVTLKSVNLGGMQVNDVQAVVTDLGNMPQISGLLGMSFFQGMDLSFRKDKLVISQGGGRSAH